MPELKFTIKNASWVTRIQNAYKQAFPKPDGVTDVQWTKRMIAQQVRQFVHQQEWEAAENAISVDVPDDVML